MNQQSKPFVMSIDDDPDVSNLIRIALRHGGYPVCSCLSGNEALRELESGRCRPDLILLDLEMPELDGYGVCRRLQAHPVWSLIPVVFLTASGSAANRLRAFQAGAVGFLDKQGMYPAILLAQVEKFLEVRRRWLDSFGSAMVPAPVPLTGFAGFRPYLEQQTGKALPQAAHPSRLYPLASAQGLSPAQLAKSIAAYCQLGYIDILDANKVKLGVLPLPFCRKYNLVPIDDVYGKTALVLSNPFDLDIEDSLQRFEFSRRFIAEPAKIQALCSGQSIIRDNVWDSVTPRRP